MNWSERDVLWSWLPPKDRWGGNEVDILIADIAEEYRIVEGDNATGIMVIGRYDTRWVANPSGRPVIAELLLRLKAKSHCRHGYTEHRYTADGGWYSRCFRCGVSGVDNG